MSTTPSDPGGARLCASRASPGLLGKACLIGGVLLLLMATAPRTGSKLACWDTGLGPCSPWPRRCSSACSGAGSTSRWSRRRGACPASRRSGEPALTAEAERELRSLPGGPVPPRLPARRVVLPRRLRPDAHLRWRREETGRRVRAVFPAVPQLGALRMVRRFPSGAVLVSSTKLVDLAYPPPRASTSRHRRGHPPRNCGRGTSRRRRCSRTRTRQRATPGTAARAICTSMSARWARRGSWRADLAAGRRAARGVLADLPPLRDAAAEAIRAGMDDPVLAVVVSVSAQKEDGGMGSRWSGYRRLFAT